MSQDMLRPVKPKTSHRVVKTRLKTRLDAPLAAVVLDFQQLGQTDRRLQAWSAPGLTFVSLPRANSRYKTGKLAKSILSI